MDKQREQKVSTSTIDQSNNKEVKTTLKSTDKRNDGGYIWII